MVTIRNIDETFRFYGSFGAKQMDVGNGTCFTFPPMVRRSRAKIISGVRSKKPSSFFQLMPHLQCCKPMNCCFIFLPQFGQTLLLFPILFSPR